MKYHADNYLGSQDIGHICFELWKSSSGIRQ